MIGLPVLLCTKRLLGAGFLVCVGCEPIFVRLRRGWPGPENSDTSDKFDLIIAKILIMVQGHRGVLGCMSGMQEVLLKW